MNQPRKLRFGVIGAGGFAEICHVPGLQTHPRAEVVALCGRRAEHARAMAERLGVPDVHTDYRELCARDDLDGVTITTPNAVHAEQALAAFARGKHVFCEKPLGATVAEVEEMVRAAEASGKVHQVAFTFRYTYCVQELRRRVRAVMVMVRIAGRDDLCSQVGEGLLERFRVAEAGESEHLSS